MKDYPRKSPVTKEALADGTNTTVSHTSCIKKYQTEMSKCIAYIYKNAYVRYALETTNEALDKPMPDESIATTFYVITH